ncbi:hypothetical protein KPH14_007113 [Odynerus spinipes]|uniref:Uncharacterized protein n=1 Tax=Odynerus spinipes TaxID=1348599 RepID=A0AAD9VSU0_9HYME|nr:hypothetical protein KPH14_007113 [Odynerus spinipes]
MHCCRETKANVAEKLRRKGEARELVALAWMSEGGKERNRESSATGGGGGDASRGGGGGSAEWENHRRCEQSLDSEYETPVFLIVTHNAVNVNAFLDAYKPPRITMWLIQERCLINDGARHDIVPGLLEKGDKGQ